MLWPEGSGNIKKKSIAAAIVVIMPVLGHSHYTHTEGREKLCDFTISRLQAEPGVCPYSFSFHVSLTL